MDQYRKNLLEQLRLCVIKKNSAVLGDLSMVKAMTVKEELKALGFVLSPEDVVRLARSVSIDSFYTDFVSMLSEVKAKPMYPDFPSQVMAMDEARFRFHQICHYQSTYGREEIARWFGLDEEVKRGWLPETEDTPKTEEDDALLEAKTLQLIDQSEEYSLPLEKLLQKPEKITLQEAEIVREALKHVRLEDIDLDSLDIKDFGDIQDIDITEEESLEGLDDIEDLDAGDLEEIVDIDGADGSVDASGEDI